MKGGCMADIEKLYTDNFEPVYRYMLTICNDSDLAEEISEETLITAIDKIDSFKGESKLSSWLISIARNLYFKKLKEDKRFIPLYIDGVCSDESKELIEEHLKECEKCQSYLSSLKESSNIENEYYDKESEDRKKNFIVNMKKEINRKKIVSALITICALVLAGTGVYKYLESAKIPVYYSEKMIVLDSNDDLVLETHGAITNETYSIRFTLNENGKKYECVVFTQYTSRLLELTAPKKQYYQVHCRL